MRKWIIIAGILCCTAVCAAPLKPFNAQYHVKYRGFGLGTVTRAFTIDKNRHYRFTIHTESSIPLINLEIVEFSEGSWTKNGPHPDLYNYRYHIFYKKRNQVTKFDWKKHIAFTQKDERRYTVKIPNDAQDRLSYQLKLRYDLLNQRKKLSYHVTDRNDIDTYIFKKVKKETLPLPIGPLFTIKMQRSNTDQKNQTIFWLAPKLHYALAKIIHVEDGEMTAEANLQHYTILKHGLKKHARQKT